MTGRRKTELAWAAGMLDGEGSIQCKHRRWVKQNAAGEDVTYEQWDLHVNISNTHKPTIEKLQEIFDGGMVGERIAGSGRPLWRIEWGSRKAAKVLQAMQPYCVTKREIVNEALRFRQLVGPRGAFGRKRRPVATWTAMTQLANSVNLLRSTRTPRTIPSQAAKAV